MEACVRSATTRMPGRQAAVAGKSTGSARSHESASWHEGAVCTPYQQRCRRAGLGHRGFCTGDRAGRTEAHQQTHRKYGCGDPATSHRSARPPATKVNSTAFSIVPRRGPQHLQARSSSAHRRRVGRGAVDHIYEAADSPMCARTGPTLLLVTSPSHGDLDTDGSPRKFGSREMRMGCNDHEALVGRTRHQDLPRCDRRWILPRRSLC